MVAVPNMRGPLSGSPHKAVRWISKADSKNGNIIVGIDVQGHSGGIDIAKNKVSLTKKSKKSKKKKTSEKHVGLRLRENVDAATVTVDGNNKFAEGIRNLTSLRRLRKVSSPHDFVNELEWKNGGCPFAKK